MVRYSKEIIIKEIQNRAVLKIKLTVNPGNNDSWMDFDLKASNYLD